MKISTKGRYGLEALLDLAIHGAGSPVSLKSISERQSISEKYLEQLFTSLKKHGIVNSIRGAQGGYEFAKEIKGITVKEVLNALEGPIAPVDCMNEDNKCDRYEACVTRGLWQKISDELNAVTEAITIADLVTCHREVRTSGGSDYYI